MIDIIAAVVAILACIIGFVIGIISWGRDSNLEKYYRETIVSTLLEPGYLPKPIGIVPQNVIIDSKQRFSPLRTYLLKKWSQLKGEKVPFIIFVFGKDTEEEQKAFLIQKAFSAIVELRLIDLDFLQSLIYYLSYEYSFKSDKIEEAVCTILRRDFENCKYRSQLLTLDSTEFSSKIVLNPPPLRKPILTNLLLPMVKEKEKELLNVDLTISQMENWKSLFMTLIEAIVKSQCAVIFIGNRPAEEYFGLYESDSESFAFFIFGARGNNVNYMQLICNRIEEDFHERWNISGTWEYENGIEICNWIIFKK